MVVLGWEDACAFVAAAEELRCPVILQAVVGMPDTHTCSSVLGPMFRLRLGTSHPLQVCHIDHATTISECQAGILIMANFS